MKDSKSIISKKQKKNTIKLKIKESNKKNEIEFTNNNPITEIII